MLHRFRPIFALLPFLSKQRGALNFDILQSLANDGYIASANIFDYVSVIFDVSTVPTNCTIPVYFPSSSI